MSKRSPSLFQRHRPSSSAPVELLSFGLYFLCAVLLVLSRIGHGALEDARDQLVDLSAPFLELASVPAIEVRRAMDRARLYVRVHRDAVEEVDRLAKENEELKQWRWRTQLLERKVAHLRKLLHAAEEPALVYATGQVIGDARGPFVRSALVNLGRNDGLRIGYAVINGDGLQTRDYVYVDDVVRANVAVLNRPGFAVYNVGTGIETDVTALYNHIADAAGIDSAPAHGPGMAGEQRRSCITSERMLEELSVAPDTPLAVGIPSTVEWFRNN